MGMYVTIETDYGESLNNIHPDPEKDKDCPLGKAILNFFGQLGVYCHWKKDTTNDIKPEILEWFQTAQSRINTQIHEKCQVLLDSQYANGGDFTPYRENDWEFYQSRTFKIKGAPEFTEEMFIQWLRDGKNAYQPIDKMIEAVKLLLEIFDHPDTKPNDWFYEPPYTNTDFEALLANLEWLANRSNSKVRLTFS